MNHSIEEHDVRVILVGRTGLDAALRLDPGIELVRVGTPLEAIGELSVPMDPECQSQAVVVVAPEVERSLREPAAGAQTGRMPEFLRGLRIADPAVRVMAVAHNGAASAPPAQGFDALLSDQLSGDALRRAVRMQPAAPAPAPAPVPAVAFAPAAPSITPDPSDPGDLMLISALIKGHEILTPALELIRVRTGDDSVQFVAQSADGAQAHGQPVTWEGAVLGHLQGNVAPAPLLAIHARWLAGWLRARDQQSQLRAAAFTDPLTGAYNRRYFERFLATAIEQAREARRHLTVMVFDIDDFKIYNDRYGHDAGDDILREIVRLMRTVIRPTDRVCRIGGDEFAVIFNEPAGPRVEGSRHPESVFMLTQRFQQQVQEHHFPKLGDCAPGTITVSGGLATYPWDGTTPEQLLSKADHHALASKRQGKNAITFGPNLKE